MANPTDKVKLDYRPVHYYTLDEEECATVAPVARTKRLPVNVRYQRHIVLLPSAYIYYDSSDVAGARLISLCARVPPHHHLLEGDVVLHRQDGLERRAASGSVRVPRFLAHRRELLDRDAPVLRDAEGGGGVGAVPCMLKCTQCHIFVCALEQSEQSQRPRGWALSMSCGQLGMPSTTPLQQAAKAATTYAFCISQ
eukprot:6186181-Pleurochrysis_carterae.AAC.2